MVRFRFKLCPLVEVSPWGDEQPRLHWFGLTEGWYCIQVGEQQLLRYRRLDPPDCYVDYYLARLWEDVIVLTPDVLEPVPADLEPFITSDPATASPTTRVPLSDPGCQIDEASAVPLDPASARRPTPAGTAAGPVRSRSP